MSSIEVLGVFDLTLSSLSFGERRHEHEGERNVVPGGIGSVPSLSELIGRRPFATASRWRRRSWPGNNL